MKNPLNYMFWIKLFFILFSIHNTKAQIYKVYETTEFIKSRIINEDSYRIYSHIILNDNRTYILYIYGFLNEFPSSYFRFYISTGEFYIKNKSLTLTDTINDYVFEYKQDKKLNYYSIKGLSCFNNMVWKDVTYINRGLQRIDYEDKGYLLFQKKGKDIDKLNNSSIKIKFVHKDSVTGLYSLNKFRESFYLSIVDDNQYFMILNDIPISSGKWQYKLGRIELHDSFFKHTFYCYMINENTMAFFNFPIIHTTLFDKDENYVFFKIKGHTPDQVDLIRTYNQKLKNR